MILRTVSNICPSVGKRDTNLKKLKDSDSLDFCCALKTIILSAQNALHEIDNKSRPQR